MRFSGRSLFSARPSNAVQLSQQLLRSPKLIRHWWVNPKNEMYNCMNQFHMVILGKITSDQLLVSQNFISVHHYFKRTIVMHWVSTGPWSPGSLFIPTHQEDQ